SVARPPLFRWMSGSGVPADADFPSARAADPAAAGLTAHQKSWTVFRPPGIAGWYTLISDICRLGPPRTLSFPRCGAPPNVPEFGAGLLPAEVAESAALEQSSSPPAPPGPTTRPGIDASRRQNRCWFAEDLRA